MSQAPYAPAVVWDRARESFQAADPAVSDTHARILAEATDGSHPADALVELLHHGDPKVRTLAAVALFDREDPSLLPDLAELAEDPAPTFDGHPELSRTWLARTGMGPPQREQTVGSVVSRMLQLHLEESGFHHGVRPRSAPGFREYWEARKDRAHCAGWFAVALQRATGGSSPTRPECVPRIRALRARIDALPEEERCWTLLYLARRTGAEALADEAEVTAACASLGPDRLLALLRRRVPSDDPDLAPRASNDFAYAVMVRRVLDDAAALFRPGDADAILEAERAEAGQRNPMASAAWSVAAARLAPSRASDILHAALERFAGRYAERSAICVALWDVCGESEGEFVVERMFRERPERTASVGARGRFVKGLAAARDGRRIVARIVRDERFAGAGWAAIEAAARVVNGWCERPVVPEDELRKAWHPLGIGHFEPEEAEAERTWPKETAELRGHLAEWVARLRESLPLWAPRETD